MWLPRYDISSLDPLIVPVLFDPVNYKFILFWSPPKILAYNAFFSIRLYWSLHCLAVRVLTIFHITLHLLGYWSNASFSLSSSSGSHLPKFLTFISESSVKTEHVLEPPILVFSLFGNVFWGNKSSPSKLLLLLSL